MCQRATEYAQRVVMRTNAVACGWGTENTFGNSSPQDPHMRELSKVQHPGCGMRNCKPFKEQETHAQHN
jgi:hypothetical protein